MIPLHEVRDPEKVKELAANIEENGWEGAPLVMWKVYGELLTGTHRYAAVQSLEWEDFEIPMIDIGDIFDEAGLDFEHVLAQYDHPNINDPLFRDVLYELPYEIREKYGIDWH